MRLLLTSSAVLLFSFAAHAAAQDAARVPGTLLVRVVDSATRRPLPNAEVSAEGRRGLTDAQGEVRVLWPAAGALRVRVRQLGFRYVERELRRPAAQTEEDTAVVALARLRWALPQVVVRGTRKCRETDARDVALSQASVELLRFGAEQFDNFRRAYPFDLTVERRTSTATPGLQPAQRGRSTVGDALEVDETSSREWGDRYVPDSVVLRFGTNQYFVPLLFVSALADSAFWDRHCFAARVESLEGQRRIRLQFFPALGVREPEWEGSAWLDSARSVLTRVDFRLTNLREEPGPQRFEGYTVFSTPSPFIAIPDSTVAWWTAGVPGGSFGGLRLSDGRQSYVIRELRYVGREPPK